MFKKLSFTLLFLAFSLSALASNTFQVFKDHQLDNPVFDPYTDQKVTFTWQQSVESPITIEIEDQRGELIKTLTNKQQYPEGRFTYTWDGKDKFGETVEEGEYKYFIISDTPNYYYDKVQGELFVRKGFDLEDQLQTPRLTSVHTNKDPWDAGINEPNSLNFTLNTEAKVTITFYDNQKQELFELLSEDFSPGEHSLSLNPQDFDNQQFSVEYRIYAQNNRGFDLEEGQIRFDEESPDGRNSPNIYNDSAINGNPYNPKNNNLEITFTLDRQAEVSLEIRNDDFIVSNVTTDTPLQAGQHSFYWNGKDNFGAQVSDGVYQYKLSAKNFKGKNVEKGNFLIEGSSNAQFVYDNCGGFSDVDKSNDYCDSIKWAKNNGIFQGYPDGSFKPNQAISRIEAVKVVLEAMNVSIIENEGEHLGFPDTNSRSWYQDYLRTALSLGIVRGYQDGYFRPEKQVLRAEGSIIVLNTARAIDNIVIPVHAFGQPFYDVPNNSSTSWYIDYAWLTKEHKLTDNEFYFYPLNPMTRAEMADYLYRYKQSTL